MTRDGSGSDSNFEDFVWGVSTSAYQIEGASAMGGKGESIWDAFTRSGGRGRIVDGSNGDAATDHYHRYPEDVRLLSDLGVAAYRFSIAWSRVMPDGKGRVEPRGVDFYLRLIESLHRAGIEPWVCLYHWDLPQALQERGGWPERDTAMYFADYVERVVSALGTSVEHYFVMNEPNVHALLGHVAGVHAPGIADLPAGLAALHHLNLGTGLGIERIRSVSALAKVGTIFNLQSFMPARRGEEHEAAAAFADVAYNRAVLDPLFRGSYPAPIAGLLESSLRDGDLVTCQTRVDMLGVNHYTRVWVEADPAASVGLRVVDPPEPAEVTAMGWEVVPGALFEMLMRLKQEYGNPPIYLTENGAAFGDRSRAADGSIDDSDRSRYLGAYLAAAAEARASGCDLRGYFVWTLVDNFEWADGYRRRFGLVELVPGTLARVPKRSYFDFQSIVRSGRLQHD